MQFWKKLTTENILKNIQSQFEKEVHSILHFWMKYMRDKENGGFYGHMSNDFKVHKNHDKHVVMPLRCLWSFSLAAKFFGNEEYTVMASETFAHVKDTFWDCDNSGFFWQSNYLNTPIDKRKFLYAQVLGIYALSEYYASSGDNSALTLADELFDIVELRCKNANGKSYVNAFEEDWKLLPHQRMQVGVDDVSVDIGVLLHVYEAYAGLYRHSASKKVLNALQDLAVLFIEKMYNPSTGLLYMYLDDDLSPTSEEIRPGHDIEFAWLAISASEYFDEKLKTSTIANAIRSVDTVRTLADKKTSTLFFTKSIKGKDVKNWRWWDQAEMILGLWHAYEVTGQEEYLHECWTCWKFVKRKFRLKSYGEWKWNVRSPKRGYSGYIAGEWKSPFHAVRAMAIVSKNAGKRLADHSIIAQ
ncbi:MAG: hypothetical protein DRI69_05910 [Bacteroidetes bacterium]|nr:MAG: hypothetical protein DRI69_05910 [Bacteroidota bacterium]